jgi:hypothetical protein
VKYLNGLAKSKMNPRQTPTTGVLTPLMEPSTLPPRHP